MQILQGEQNTEIRNISQRPARWLNLLMSVLNPSMEIAQLMRDFLDLFPKVNENATKRSHSAQKTTNTCKLNFIIRTADT